MPGITIAIADPHPIVRAGMRAFITAQPDFRVIGEAGTIRELLDLIAAKPDYVVVDPFGIDIPFERLMASVLALPCPSRVIAHGVSHDPDTIGSIYRAGASAYVPKDGPAEQLIEAIRALEAGRAYVSPLALPHGWSAQKSVDPRVVLSRREYDIFLALGSGARPRDVARSLGLSPKTVDTYRAKILRKLHLDGMASLVRRAAETDANSSCQ